MLFKAILSDLDQNVFFVSHQSGRHLRSVLGYFLQKKSPIVFEKLNGTLNL